MVNVVTSSEVAVGEVLTTHPDVDMISFTGSTAIGRRIMEVASKTVKRVFLELGGKSAMVVLDDADFGLVRDDRGLHHLLALGAGLRDHLPAAGAARAPRRDRRAGRWHASRR